MLEKGAVIAVLYGLLILTAAHAQSCNELAGEIRGIQSGGFAEYPQLNDVKQGTLIMLYGREKGECPERLISFATAAKEFILDFDTAYKLTKSGIPEDVKQAVDISHRLKNEVLPELSQKSGELGATAENIINSAEFAISDFLINQADINVREAETTTKSKEKILRYQYAVSFYEAAGESLQASNIKIKLDVLEEQYKRDMDAADKLYSAGERGYKEAISKAKPVGISAYIKCREALATFRDALSYYEYHVETEKIEKTEEAISKARATMLELRYRLAVEFILLAIILISFSVFFVNRILEWEEDSYEYYLGNDLIRVKRHEV